jgi:hypothetical protein
MVADLLIPIQQIPTVTIEKVVSFMSRVKLIFAFLGIFISNSFSQESWIRINQLGYT